MPKSSVKKRMMKRSTKKRRVQSSKPHIVKKFMELLTMIKLYHWKTHSYSQHKATDELYEKLNENIDKFVEVLLGKSGARIKMLESKMNMYDLETKTELREHLFEYRQFLVDMNRTFHEKKDSDLLSVRDDILADINQFLYLLTFDK
jgi:DNA-binding ferritin-like protein